MINSAFSVVTGFVYDKTIVTVQLLRKNNDISGFGLSKMIGKASAVALITGLVTSRISIPRVIPMVIGITGGLTVFSSLLKGYDYKDQFWNDWNQQKTCVERHPFLEKIFQKQFSEI